MRRRMRAEAGFISIDQARKILRKGGLELSDDEIKTVLDFLYKMANDAVAYYLELPQEFRKFDI